MKDILSMGTLREYIIEKVKDSEAAEAYLKAAILEYAEFQDVEALRLALRTITIAQGGLGFLVEKSGVRMERLFAFLSEDLSAPWDTLEAFLKGLGYAILVNRTPESIH